MPCAYLYVCACVSVCVFVFVFVRWCLSLLVSSVSSCCGPVFIVAGVPVEACTLASVKSAILFMARLG